MAENTKIEWTRPVRPDGSLMPGHTANLWHGCVAVHAGCFNCYAEVLAHRWGDDLWGNDKPRKAIKKVWGDLSRAQRQAEALDEQHYVFVGSMMDIAEKPMPLIDSQGNPIGPIAGKTIDTGYLRNMLFESVVPACPNLIFLFLSKRPGNYNKYIPDSWKDNPPDNVMFGTSVVDPGTYNTYVPQLLKVNGRRFLSIEPQLAGIAKPDLTGIDWVIQGGESGHHKRPFDLAWARHMRDECTSAGVPYFFKQIDKIQPIPADLQVRQFPYPHATAKAA